MIYYLESLLCVYYYHYHYLTVIANYLLLVYYRIIPFPTVFQHLHRVYPTFLTTSLCIYYILCRVSGIYHYSEM